MPTYAFTLSITAADARNAVVAVFNAVQGFVKAEADPDDATNTLYFLAFGGTKVQAGTDPKTGAPVFVRAAGVMAYNQDVPQNVASVVAAASAYCTTFSPSPPLTRAQLDARALLLAGQNGADHAWQVHPGDNMTVANAAALLAKFSQIPGTA
jgi:hypothetical protein